MKKVFGVALLLGSLSAAGQTVIDASDSNLKLGCQYTRLGCDYEKLDYINYFTGGFSNLLVSKLPKIGSDSSAFPTTNKFGIALENGEGFTVIKCTSKIFRTVVNSCSFDESVTDQGLKVLTPVEFYKSLYETANKI